MKFEERKEFTYDPALFRRSDTQTALKIHYEYVRRFSPHPFPKFFEVDRKNVKIDDLWHFPLDDRTVFSRVLEIPALNQFQKPDWRLTKLGLIPLRKDTFWLANLGLQEFDYFPENGDQVFWNGYRYTIRQVVLDPKAYWQQTGVWLGMVVECIIAPQGDAKPIVDVSVAVPAELPRPQLKPEP